jgi:hypothetical protein
LREKLILQYSKFSHFNTTSKKKDLSVPCKEFKTLRNNTLGEKPGLVVREEGHGFESHCILDGSKNYICNEKKNNKGSQMGHTKKYI